MTTLSSIRKNSKGKTSPFLVHHYHVNIPSEKAESRIQVQKNIYYQTQQKKIQELGETELKTSHTHNIHKGQHQTMNKGNTGVYTQGS